MLTIKYGIPNIMIDITTVVLDKCVKQNIAYIPAGDEERALLFTDPVWGKVKLIYINGDTSGYDAKTHIFLDLSSNEIFINDIPESIRAIYPNIVEKITQTTVLQKLRQIHLGLKLEGGSFNEEFPEQLMATRYLTGNEKVLEIGGNIGRNSLVIASILNKVGNSKLVTLESNTAIYKELLYNREINQLEFYIENSALSKRKLIQSHWYSEVSDIVKPGYFPVNIMTYADLLEKYNIQFDTLVLDCEGAFYYILKDMPEVLDHVTLIIMENDYWDIAQKEYLDSVLLSHNFHADYTEAGGWGPCESCFFQVWKLSL